MRIQVGIHDNVILQKAGFNDKGRFVLYLRQLGEGKEEKPDNPFEQMNAAEVVEEESSGGLIMWPFKLAEKKDKQGNERSDRERGEMVSGDIQRFKNVLQQILEQYTTKDSIKWSIFDGAAISQETYYDDLLSEANLDIIYKNTCEQFMAMIQPFLDDDKYPVRFKLARQSADKHYARIPDRFIKENPFIEPMSVPAAQSRVKWTPYEISNKLNDPTPVSRAAADPVEDSPEDESAFGQR